MIESVKQGELPDLTHIATASIPMAIMYYDEFKNG